ncbi:MAG: hypothetical protein M5R41_17475 [Bacteroidia bacterium]|nr:hypothetical protein [Bacteroidia bacterium]
MDSTGQINQKRLSDHDYSEPGTYHLRFDVGKHGATLGTMCGGVMTLNVLGEMLLGVLGVALQVFTCLRIDAMDIRPRCVEFVVTITSLRKPFISCFTKVFDRWLYRRQMTISAFAGYVKMNSGRRINTARNASGKHFWTLGYKDRVLTDQREIERVCARLDVRFRRVRFSLRSEVGSESMAPVQSFSSAMKGGLRSVFGALFGGEVVVPMSASVELPCDTMLMGKVLFLNNSLLRPLTGIFGSGESAPGGRTRVPLIWSVGPGRIFPRDSDAY